jgi:hypothetical protein
MSSINWQFQAAILGGPSFTLSESKLVVDAYDVATATIPTGGAATHVPIQPTSTAGSVLFVVVSSSQYDPQVSYTVDALTVAHALDAPHILTGAGAVALLNSAASPQTLVFTNNLAKDITVQVVVGRKIT